VLISTEELAWDPKVDSEEIAVAADDGTVTLRGTVGSFRKKREARKAAERVYGVLYVNNDLNVRILDENRHDDGGSRGDCHRSGCLCPGAPTPLT